MSDWDAAAEWAAGEVREGRALHRLVAEELDAAQREALRRVALVVLRPHALEAGDGGAIVRHLEAELGARPVAIRVYPRLSPALVGALYARQAKIPRGRMWLQEEAFGSGPSAALLLACEQAPEPSLTERLYAGKGPSSALEPAPGSLRERFGRASSLHAVLHVPDDLRSLVVEASLFFSWAQLRAAGTAQPVGLDLVEELVGIEPRPGRSVFEAALKVKRRILAAVAVVAGREHVAALWELTTQADSGLAGLAYLDQRTAMLAFARDERQPLAQAIEALQARLAAFASTPSAQPAPGTAPRADAPAARAAAGGPSRARADAALRAAIAPVELLSASWYLSGHEAYGADGGERLFGALEAGGVPLSASQRALLTVGLATDLHPAARVDPRRLWPLGPDPAA